MLFLLPQILFYLNLPGKRLHVPQHPVQDFLFCETFPAYLHTIPLYPQLVSHFCYDMDYFTSDYLKVLSSNLVMGYSR